MARKGRLGQSKYVFFFICFVCLECCQSPTSMCVCACVHECVCVSQGWHISCVLIKL